MQKSFSKVLRLSLTALATATLLFFAACEKETPESQIAGTWNLTSLEIAGSTLTIDEIINQYGQIAIQLGTDFECLRNSTATFQADGNGSLFFRCDPDTPTLFTYTISGSTVTAVITRNGEPETISGTVNEDYSELKIDNFGLPSGFPNLGSISLVFTR